MISKSQAQLVLIKQKMDIKALQRSGVIEKDKKNMQQIKTNHLIFYIQNNALKAFLIKTELFDPATSLEKLKTIIADQGILHGVATDERLQHFLDSDKYIQNNYFTLAVGDAPVQSIDVMEKLYFDEQYQNAGQISIDGSIDYKERGTIPSVEKGDLLAEKIPAREGEAGINIFDEIIPPETPKEILLKSGPGTEISEDGLRLYAMVNGYPKKEISGEIVVNEIYIINGDVDYRTGNVKYDKSVNISGSIKNGFKVNAIDIVVDEVDGGILHASGDIIVKKGIIDAQVKAKGKIKAGYILRSHVSCFGDIEAVKEISDSEIFSDGRCKLRSGKVLASSITAKSGAYIKNIGGEKAKRMSIIVGTSPNFENQIKKIDIKIEENQNELEIMTYKKNNAHNEIKEIEAQIHMHTPADIDDLAIQKQKLETDFIKYQKAEKKYSKLVKDNIKEKFLLKQADQKNQPRPIVKVEGTIVAGTFIFGRYSKIIIHKKQNRVKIMETKIPLETYPGKNPWEMVISSL